MKTFQLFPKKFGVFPYVFLLYLALPIFYVANESGFKAWIGYALIVLFFITYRQLYWSPPVKMFTFWLTVQISIVVILSLWVNPNHLFMGFFPAHFIGWYVNKQHFHWALGLFAAVIVLTMTVGSITGMAGNLIYLLPFIAVMLASPFGIRTMNRQMELEKQLNQANEQIKDLIKREERVRIARDLHDTLGHTLSLITLQSQLVQRLAEKNPEKAKIEAKEIEKTSRSALRQVRELVSDMRMITVAEELADMEQIFLAAEIKFHTDGEFDLSHLSLLQQNILGMCLREAGTNIVKHSQAKNCNVTFRKARGGLTIIVKDDGIGIAEKSQGGNGLKGMKERLALIEGTLDIRSSRGTTVTINLPLIEKQEREGIA